MRQVRAKFRVTKVAKLHYQKDAAEITLEPQYDPTIPEDQRFQQATPWGVFTMQVTNPAAVEVLELGKAFYLDLTPVAEDSVGNTVTAE